MDISRLNPNIAARLRVSDTAAPDASAANPAATTDSPTVNSSWEQALATQCTANPSDAPGSSGRLSTSQITALANGNFRTQNLTATATKETAVATTNISTLPEVPQPDPAPPTLTLTNGRLNIESLVAANEATPATVTKPVTATALANSITSIVESSTSAAVASKDQLLPLQQIAQERGLINRADIRLDPNSDRWSAEWASPTRPFHYGMLLKPALLQYIKDGQSFTFQDGNNQVQTISNHGGEIVVGDAGQKSEKVLDSQGLKHLLQSKIKSSGFELYLTQRGSLILATSAGMAKSMALAQ
jgi:hypothetical protein